LNELEPQLREYFLRAAQATPKSLTMTEAAAKDAQLASGAGGGSAGPQEPPKNYIWTLNGPSDQSDRWGTARYAISQTKYRADVALQSRVQYPDPLKETSNAYDWSPESRRVLSAYWLQGELERDVATEIIASLRDESTVQEFQDRCFVTIERFFAPAKELAAVKSTQGSVIIREPKATPYARHAKATRYTLQELQEEFPDENIAWVIGQTIAFSDMIEDLQFGRTEGVTMSTAVPLRERYEMMKALAEEERQRLLAEEERKRQELAKQEEERKAKEAAEEERQRQLAEAAKAKAAEEAASKTDAANTAAQAQAPLAGGPGRGAVGPGFGRPPFGMGANRNGSERFPSSSTAPDQAEAFAGGPPPGFGQRPSSGPPQGANPAGPPGQPPSLGPAVTILITGSGNLDIASYVEKLKTALKTANYQTSQSGNEATIKLGFAGDLKAVIDAIDFGKVESSDPAKREISVTVD
jgi:chemotaxis protein histidine kinase CheA